MMWGGYLCRKPTPTLPDARIRSLELVMFREPGPDASERPDSGDVD